MGIPIVSGLSALSRVPPVIRCPVTPTTVEHLLHVWLLSHRATVSGTLRKGPPIAPFPICFRPCGRIGCQQPLFTPEQVMVIHLSIPSMLLLMFRMGHWYCLLNCACPETLRKIEVVEVKLCKVMAGHGGFKHQMPGPLMHWPD